MVVLQHIYWPDFIKPNQKEGGKDASHVASEDTKSMASFLKQTLNLGLRHKCVYSQESSRDRFLEYIFHTSTSLFDLFRALPKGILKHLKILSTQ